MDTRIKLKKYRNNSLNINPNVKDLIYSEPFLKEIGFYNYNIGKKNKDESIFNRVTYCNNIKTNFVIKRMGNPKNNVIKIIEELSLKNKILNNNYKIYKKKAIDRAENIELNRTVKNYKIKKALRQTTPKHIILVKDNLLLKNNNENDIGIEYYLNNNNLNTNNNLQTSERNVKIGKSKSQRNFIENNKDKNKKIIHHNTKNYFHSKKETNYFYIQNVIFIQSFWRGYFLRKLVINSLEQYFGLVFLCKHLSGIFLQKKIIYFKQFISIINEIVKHNNIFKKNNTSNNFQKIESIRIFEKKNVNLNFYKVRAKKLIYRNSKDKKFNVPSSFVYKHKNTSCDYSNNLCKYQNKKIENQIIINYINRNSFKNKLRMLSNTGDNFPKTARETKNDKIKNNLINIFKFSRSIVKYINKKYYYFYFPIFIYRIRILMKLKIMENKYNHLKNVINLMESKYLKKYYKIYREKIIDKKIILMINNKINQKKDDNDKIGNNKYIITVNLKNDFENKTKKIKNDISSYKKNETFIDDITNQKKKELILSKIFNKKISRDKIKYNNDKLKNYFNIWEKIINNGNINKLELSQKKSPKTKYIKVFT